MLTKRIIPCLDVDKGRVVKGITFVNLKDAGDPAELASFYDSEGADELIFLDITASIQDRDTMVDVVQRVSEKVFIPLTVGGGIRNLDDVRRLLKAGADKISINTAAVNNPSFIKQASDQFGSQCIVIAIDARRVSSQNISHSPNHELNPVSESRWEVHINGGHSPTGLDAVEWARKATRLGAGEILLTSMDCDGTKDGYDLELTKAVSQATSVPVIASGGAGNLSHLYQALTQGQADAVLAASIFHFGIYQIAEAKSYLASKGLPVRIV